MKQRNIAKDYDEFVKRVLDAIMEVGNNTIVGGVVMDELLAIKLKDDPNMSQEEWENTKQQFMVFLFHQFLVENPDLMKEFGSHLYKKITENDI